MEDTKRFVCVGKLFLTDGKLGVGLLELIGGKPVGDVLAFSARAVTARAGAVYDIPCSEKEGRTSIIWKKHVYVAMYPEEDKVLEWQLQTQAAEVRARVQRHERKDTSIERAMKWMEPIARVYRKADRLDKRAIEVMVLEYLRRSI